MSTILLWLTTLIIIAGLAGCSITITSDANDLRAVSALTGFAK